MGADLVLIWIGWMLAGGSPGPATMAIAGTAMDRGRAAGLAVSGGILAGSACWGIAAAAGLSAVMVANAWAFEVLRFAGAGYLLFLAFKALRAAWAGRAAAPGAAMSGDAARLFAKGMALHLTNPKAILSWGSIYTIAAPPGAGPADLAWYFAFFYAGSLVLFPSYAVLFSSAGVVRAYRAAKRWFDLAFAGVFGAAGVGLLTARVQ